MANRIEMMSKEQLARFLPDALNTAINSYHAFMAQEIKQEPKDFAAHHAACKAAIAHIELLLKFARWADLPDAQAANHNNQIVLAAIMREAEDELQKYRDSGAEDEDLD